MKRWLCLLLLLVAAAGRGADYYVQNGGDDTAAGTEGAPWANCPGMPGWSPGASGNSITAGDTVYFDSGDTWSSSTSAVLTATAGVTYIGDTWGTGTRAKFAGTAALTNWSIVQLNSSDVTLQGFECDGGGYPGGIRANAPIASANISGITVKNVVVHNTHGTSEQYIYGIQFGSVDGYTISDSSIIDCTVYDVTHEGIALYPSASGGTNNNLTVRGCEVYNTGQGIGSAAFGIGILIKRQVTNSTIEFNYLHDNNDGIQFEGVESLATTGITIRYNIIKNSSQFGLVVYNTDEEITFDFYSNLIVDAGVGGGTNGSGFWFGTGGYTSCIFKIHNNTVITTGNTATNRAGLRINDSYASGTWNIQNNIFYTDDHVAIYDAYGIIDDAGTHGNNLYYRTSGSGDNVIYDAGNNYTRGTTTTYEASAQNTDPTFKNFSNSPTGFSGTYGTDMVPDADGLSIESGDALGNGADLGDTYRGAINLSGTDDGLTRDDAAAWDIGAYQYGAEGEPPVSSSLMMVLAQVYLLLLWNGVGAILAVATGLKVIGKI